MDKQLVLGADIIALNLKAFNLGVELAVQS